ncbi:MAG: hypothetical protein RL518_272 [Pseudomonadota bacterium]
MYGGAALLAAISGAILLADVPSVWVPMPLPIMLAAIITLKISLIVTPVLYLVVVKLSSQSTHFAKIVLALVAVLGALNIIYFQNAWEYGVTYQGPEHTRIVAIENMMGFGAALGMAFVATAKKSSSLAYSANLFLFVLLSWCAFPWLGELP